MCGTKYVFKGYRTAQGKVKINLKILENIMIIQLLNEMFDSEYNFLLFDEFRGGQNIICYRYLFAFLPLSFRIKCYC